MHASSHHFTHIAYNVVVHVCMGRGRRRYERRWERDGEWEIEGMKEREIIDLIKVTR